MITKRARKQIVLSALTAACMALVLVFTSACTSKPQYTEYSVTFNADGGSEVASAKSSTVTGKVTKPANPTKEGYLFDNWYTASNGGGTAYNFNSVVAEDMTLYAKWTRDFPPSGYDTGKSYLVPALAWHESLNQASMMASLLYKDAYVSVENDHVELTIYFIAGEIMGIPVSPNEVKSIRYLKDDAYVPVVSSYDFFTNVLSVTFSLDYLSEFTTLKMDFDGDKTLRLKLNVPANVVSEDEPLFRAAERAYLVPVAAKTATDGTSMMAPLFYEYSYIKVGSETIKLYVYFQPGVIQPPMGGPVTISDINSTIVSFEYKDLGGDDYKSSILVYDAVKDLKRAELTLSTTDIQNLEAVEVRVTYSLNGGVSTTTATLKLVLDIGKAEVTANDP